LHGENRQNRAEASPWHCVGSWCGHGWILVQFWVPNCKRNRGTRKSVADTDD